MAPIFLAMLSSFVFLLRTPCRPCSSTLQETELRPTFPPASIPISQEASIPYILRLVTMDEKNSNVAASRCRIIGLLGSAWKITDDTVFFGPLDCNMTSFFFYTCSRLFLPAQLSTGRIVISVSISSIFAINLSEVRNRMSFNIPPHFDFRFPNTTSRASQDIKYSFQS
jgi:hypothetical protein